MNARRLCSCLLYLTILCLLCTGVLVTFVWSTTKHSHTRVTLSLPKAVQHDSHDLVVQDSTRLNVQPPTHSSHVPPHDSTTHPCTNSSKTSSPSELIKLDWTSLIGTHHDNSYHFFSAYYDGRSSSSFQRPAIIVMGYVFRKVPTAVFHCLLHYQNGRSVCSTKPAHERVVASCFDTDPNIAAKSYHYLCEMSVGDEVPVAIQLSTSAQCEPEYNSAMIPVRNVNSSLDAKPPKKFGVCIGSPLVQNNNKDLLKDVIEYIEMNKVLGVDLLVWYVNETQVDREILDFVWTHYPDTVRTIGWRAFEKWDPLHYYGQELVISDCYYRHMYEVDYFAVTDLDEMITPVKDGTWAAMMNSINPSADVSAFTFPNAFFTASEGAKDKVIPECPHVAMPKYFTRLDRHKCKPGYEYRIKAIHQARYIYEISVHWSCLGKVTDHENWINVPAEIGISAHYRPTIPGDCPVHHPKDIDYVAVKLMKQVTQNICYLYNNTQWNFR